MNVRIFLVGLAGGILVRLALDYPLYRYLPAQFVDGWGGADARLAAACLAGAVVLLFLTGLAAGRMSGAGRRLGAAGAGAAAGLTAALLAELLIVGAAMGVWGSRLMLAHGLHATRDEAEFMTLLSHGTVSIIWWTYLSIWAAGAAGAVLGGLGGLAAGKTGAPAGKQTEVWLGFSASAALASLLNLVMVTAIYVALVPILKNVGTKIADLYIPGYSLPYPPTVLLILPVVTGLAWLVFWQFVAWRLVRRLPPSRSTSFLGVSLATLLVPVAGLPLFARSTMNFFYGAGEAASAGPSLLGFPLTTYLIVILGLAAAAALLWGAGKMRFQPRPASARISLARLAWNRTAKFFGDAGQARLAGVHFAVIAVLACLLTFPIAAGQAALMPWLAGGLALNLIFAGLGVFDAWKVARTPAPEPDLPTGAGVFAGTALGGSFLAGVSILNSLASLSLVLLPVVMIAQLMLHDEAQAAASVQAQGTSLRAVIDMSYAAPQALTYAAVPAVLAVAMLAAAVGVVWRRYRLSRLPAQAEVQH